MAARGGMQLAKPLEKLFETVQVGKLELKNRIKLPAMGIAFEKDARVSEQTKEFYAERARGGVALIGISCSATRLDEGPLYGIYDDSFVPGLVDLVNVIHANGARAYAQVGVGYSWAFGDRPVELVSPSGITPTGRPGSAFRLGGPRQPTMPSALSNEEIRHMVEAFGDGALRAKRAGFDAVEVIASVSYIISQFISLLTNRRTDKYGGSLENRMRFLLEIIGNIQAKAGKDYPITCRLSGSDLMGPNGYDLQDTKQMAEMLEEAGVCQIDVMSGWHYASVPVIQTWVPQGAWVYMAEEVKKAVNIPVAAGTQIQDPVVAERVLAEGKVDMIYMARALIADPELPNKAKEGRLEDIRPCMNCCRCISAVDNLPVYCSVNARVGREAAYPNAKLAQARKKVLIVGGGPAGMEAARVAALRGHTVTLCDQNHRLGGALLLASVTNRRLGPVLRYMQREVWRLPIDVKLGTRVTVQWIERMRPDIVVLALGGTPSPLRTHVANSEIILDRRDIQAILVGRTKQGGGLRFRTLSFLSGLIVRYLYNPRLIWWLLRFSFPFGKRVVILGGDFAGCELADTLTERGKQVAIIEASNRIGSDIEITHRWVLLKKLREAGVKMVTGAKVTEVVDRGVKIEQSGLIELVEADTVVNADMDTIPKLDWQPACEVADVHIVGDSAEPGKLMEAVASGFIVGHSI
jgi:2,4-dienoyl-CoA reductase (NADPH2)